MSEPTMGKVRTEVTDPIPKFVEIRTNAIELFKHTVYENGKDASMDGHDVLVDAASKAIDLALSGALIEVQDNFFGFIASAEMTEGEEDTNVDIRLKANLAQSYFEAVSS